jgi:formate transporter
MSDKKMLIPSEIAQYTIDAGIKKANTPTKKVLASAFLAGAYITFAALGSMGAAHNLLGNPETYGLGKLVAGLLFPAGLMLVLVAGADLFTGNILIAMAALNKKVTWSKTFKNWALVWVGNLLGAALVAWMVSLTGVFDWSNGVYGGVVIKTAVGKVHLAWIPAFVSGILCNWLVCVAVWMSYGAKDMAGKITSIFPGVCLFIVLGFEHSIANMGYLFAGFFAKSNTMWIEASHKTSADLANLNLSSIFANNLIPVTLGNIVGGAVFVGAIYYFMYIEKSETIVENKTAA